MNGTTSIDRGMLPVHTPYWMDPAAVRQIGRCHSLGQPIAKVQRDSRPTRQCRHRSRHGISRRSLDRAFEQVTANGAHSEGPGADPASLPRGSAQPTVEPLQLSERNTITQPVEPASEEAVSDQDDQFQVQEPSSQTPEEMLFERPKEDQKLIISMLGISEAECNLLMGSEPAPSSSETAEGSVKSLEDIRKQIQQWTSDPSNVWQRDAAMVTTLLTYLTKSPFLGLYVI